MNRKPHPISIQECQCGHMQFEHNNFTCDKCSCTHFDLIPSGICEHEGGGRNGEWGIENGKSYAICKKCNKKYQTTLALQKADEIIKIIKNDLLNDCPLDHEHGYDVCFPCMHNLRVEACIQKILNLNL